jgi:hypothetical protein
VDLSETVGKKSTTRQLAIVLLRDAVQREDHQTVREVIDRWTQPDRYTVPQVTRHLVTVTDLEFARTAVEAALALDEPQALQQASAYLQWVQHAWQAAEQGE